jgi:hypothetical protein
MRGWGDAGIRRSGDTEIGRWREREEKVKGRKEEEGKYLTIESLHPWTLEP